MDDRRSLTIGVLLSTILVVAAPLCARAQLAPPGDGTIRALVIGINRYETQPTLRGAEADARDLAQALGKGGVRDLTLLTNEQASRRAVVGAMERLAAGARAGDLVFISFAGHGSQTPERVKGSDPDGVDEVFVLPGFRERGSGTAERILDKEINVWLRRIEQNGAHTLFLADTCHGGGLTRDVDPRAGALSYRQTTITIAPFDDALDPVSSAADRARQPPEFDRVTFLAAADKWTKAPEVRIPGQATLRGALSYAVARAFEGAAAGADGRTTRRALFEYARQVAQQYSESRQDIYSEPRARVDLLDTVVFRRAGVPADAPVPPPDPAADTTVRVAVLNGSPASLAGVKPAVARIEPVAADAQPDLVWDVANGDVVSGAGDVIARGVGKRDIADVIDRTAAVIAIARLAEQRAQRITLLPSNRHHRPGERVTFRTEGVAGKSVVLFNLASDGTVQFLYPNKKADRPVVAESDLPLDDIDVRPPFGADYVVAVVSDGPLRELAAAIKGFDDVRAAARIPALLRKHILADKSARIGFAGAFTVP
ncbi:MAG: caspase [Proteobacteria bacterium]|nr:MAG: caspase [Pseudomonadota bacterium]